MHPKVSEAARRRWADPAYRGKRAASQKVRMMTPEERAALSERNRRAWAKKAVISVGLPLLRKFVDRAALLYSQGCQTDGVRHWLAAKFAAEIDVYAEARRKAGEMRSAA